MDTIGQCTCQTPPPPLPGGYANSGETYDFIPKFGFPPFRSLANLAIVDDNSDGEPDGIWRTNPTQTTSYYPFFGSTLANVYYRSGDYIILRNVMMDDVCLEGSSYYRALTNLGYTTTPPSQNLTSWELLTTNIPTPRMAWVSGIGPVPWRLLPGDYLLLPETYLVIRSLDYASLTPYEMPGFLQQTPSQPDAALPKWLARYALPAGSARNYFWGVSNPIARAIPVGTYTLYTQDGGTRYRTLSQTVTIVDESVPNDTFLASYSIDTPTSAGGLLNKRVIRTDSAAGLATFEFPDPPALTVTSNLPETLPALETCDLVLFDSDNYNTEPPFYATRWAKYHGWAWYNWPPTSWPQVILQNNVPITQTIPAYSRLQLSYGEGFSFTLLYPNAKTTKGYYTQSYPSNWPESFLGYPPLKPWPELPDTTVGSLTYTGGLSSYWILENLPVPQRYKLTPQIQNFTPYSPPTGATYLEASSTTTLQTIRWNQTLPWYLDRLALPSDAILCTVTGGRFRPKNGMRVEPLPASVRVALPGGTLPTGLQTGTIYYIRPLSTLVKSEFCPSDAVPNSDGTWSFTGYQEHTAYRTGWEFELWDGPGLGAKRINITSDGDCYAVNSIHPLCTVANNIITLHEVMASGQNLTNTRFRRRVLFATDWQSSTLPYGLAFREYYAHHLGQSRYALTYDLAGSQPVTLSENPGCLYAIAINEGQEWADHNPNSRFASHLLTTYCAPWIPGITSRQVQIQLRFALSDEYTNAEFWPYAFTLVDTYKPAPTATPFGTTGALLEVSTHGSRYDETFETIVPAYTIAYWGYKRRLLSTNLPACFREIVPSSITCDDWTPTLPPGWKTGDPLPTQTWTSTPTVDPKLADFQINCAC